MEFAALAISLFGSLCFLTGAWWVTRPNDDPEPDERQLRSVAASCSYSQRQRTGAKSGKMVEKVQSETLPAGPRDLPTIEELLDQFDRIFAPKLLEDLRRSDNSACLDPVEPGLVLRLQDEPATVVKASKKGRA